MSGHTDLEFVPLNMAAVRAWFCTIVGQPIYEDPKPWEGAAPAGRLSPSAIRRNVASILDVSEVWIDVTFSRVSRSITICPSMASPPWFDHAFKREFRVP